MRLIPIRTGRAFVPTIAGGAALLAACCVAWLLLFLGILSGVSGLVIAGAEIGVGLTVGAIAWLVAWGLRRRRSGRDGTSGLGSDTSP